MSINDPSAVREQYASEERLETRRTVWHGDSAGRQPQDVAAASIAAVAATSILEVGCGTGVFAARLQTENPKATLVATDQSPRLMQLTRERGVEAQVADVMNLPFEDASFDVVVAMWMLYHVPDLDGALTQIRRVLGRDGLFVAVTNGDEHLAGLLREAGGDPLITTFSTETGAGSLARHFDRVEQTDLATRAVFADHLGAQTYLATFDNALAATLPVFSGGREYAGATSVFACA